MDPPAFPCYHPNPSILIQQQEDSDNESTPSKRSGKRKIKIEYIEDKSRRHITFSKRKAGIMKKAYELSTLTGTQVLLLVVSETGLVYTFTTPKLQPIVTNPEGKNLIQACLNEAEKEPYPTSSSNNNTAVKSEPCDPVYTVPAMNYDATPVYSSPPQAPSPHYHTHGQQIHHQQPSSRQNIHDQHQQQHSQLHLSHSSPQQTHPYPSSSHTPLPYHHHTSIPQQTQPVIPTDMYQTRYYQGDYSTPPTPYPSYNYPPSYHQ